MRTALVRVVLWFSLALSGTSIPVVQAADSASAKSLLERYSAAKLEAGGNSTSRRFSNPFTEPIFLKSFETTDRLTGEIYALVDHPFDQVRSAVSKPEHWCDILILALNVKYCRAADPSENQALDVALGRKFDQPLASAFWAHFSFRKLGTGPDHIALEMLAPVGPMSTFDYRILFESVPLDSGQTVLHLTYSYGYDSVARWAMKVYLATVGREKVGFSQAAESPNGSNKLVAGVLGVVERNTMRFYLAVDAYLSAQGAAEVDPLPLRLNYWHSATERYARQLHEIDRSTYVAMKLREVERQKTSLPLLPRPSK